MPESRAVVVKHSAWRQGHGLGQATPGALFCKERTSSSSSSRGTSTAANMSQTWAYITGVVAVEGIKSVQLSGVVGSDGSVDQIKQGLIGQRNDSLQVSDFTVLLDVCHTHSRPAQGQCFSKVHIALAFEARSSSHITCSTAELSMSQILVA